MSDKSSQAKDASIQLRVGVGLFIVMFAMAFALPENLQLSAMNGFTERAINWLPNARRIAERSKFPNLVEVYLLLSVGTSLIALLLFVAIRPRGSTTTPLESHLSKLLGVILMAAFSLLFFSLLRNPAAADFKVGFLEGRWAAAMTVALSSRLGVGVMLNLLFCVGPYLVWSLTWMGITKPVRSRNRNKPK